MHTVSDTAMDGFKFDQKHVTLELRPSRAKAFAYPLSNFPTFQLSTSPGNTRPCNTPAPPVPYRRASTANADKRSPSHSPAV